MAVINQYKMYGVTSTAAEGPIKFFGTDPATSAQLPLISETYVVKSLHVTNRDVHPIGHGACCYIRENRIAFDHHGIR